MRDITIDSIRNCDLLVAYLGDPLSYGVQMELGFAAAFEKPIIVIHESHINPPYLVNGLGGITRFSNVTFNNEAELLDQLHKQVEAIRTAL